MLKLSTINSFPDPIWPLSVPKHISLNQRCFVGHTIVFLQCLFAKATQIDPKSVWITIIRGLSWVAIDDDSGSIDEITETLYTTNKSFCEPCVLTLDYCIDNIWLGPQLAITDWGYLLNTWIKNNLISWKVFFLISNEA